MLAARFLSVHFYLVFLLYRRIHIFMTTDQYCSKSFSYPSQYPKHPTHIWFTLRTGVEQFLSNSASYNRTTFVSTILIYRAERAIWQCPRICVTLLLTPVLLMLQSLVRDKMYIFVKSTNVAFYTYQTQRYYASRPLRKWRSKLGNIFDHGKNRYSYLRGAYILGGWW